MFIINACIRKKLGKSASRRLRHDGKLPAIVYGKNQSIIPIEIDQDQITNMSSKKEFFTEILSLQIDEKTISVKIHALQRHAFKPKISHIDFMHI